MKKYNYIYKITNINPLDERKYYIGVRSSIVEPHNDVHYWSSSNYLKKSISEQGIENFIKEILSIWDSREEAVNEEIRLHAEFDVSKNPEFYNKSRSISTGFSPDGMLVVKNILTGKNESIPVAQYKNNPNYKLHTTGTVLVIDKQINKSKRIKREEFDNDLNNRYELYFKGRAMVKDLLTGELKFMLKSEFENNPDVVGINKNRITVVDQESNKTMNITLEEFKNNKDKYKFILGGKILARDIDNNPIWIEKDEFHKRNDLVGNNYGRVVVRNKNTGKQELITQLEFYSSDVYEALSAGGIMVRNKKTGKCKRISKEEMNNNKDLYEGINKGYSNAFDIIHRKIIRVSVNEFKNNPNLVNNQSNYYRIFDSNGIERYLEFGNPSKWCKENNFPLSAFYKSAKNNGSLIFLNPTIHQQRLIKLRDWYKFINWYVVKGKVVELVEKNVK